MGGFAGTLELSTAGLHLTTSDPTHILGTSYRTNDGRSFRYAKAGGALTIGRAIGHIAKAPGLASDGLSSGAAGRTTAEWDSGTRTFAVATTASASTSLHIYANRFDDGYLWVNDSVGEGQLMNVKSHGVSTSSGTTAVTITMYDDELLTVALTAATQWGLTENLYKDVVVHTGTTGGGPALGVAPRAVDSGQYFWLQTWGPCPVITQSYSYAGEPAVCGISTGTSTGLANVAGSAYPANTTMTSKKYLQPEIGIVITPSTGNGEYALVFLTCAP